MPSRCVLSLLIDDRCLQVGALWEAVLDVDERPVSIDATLSPISCPKSFQPPLSDESRLYRIAMPREVPQLEPGKYRFAVTVTHTLLTRRAQQSATRQQAPVLDEDALATSYLPIESVRVGLGCRVLVAWPAAMALATCRCRLDGVTACRVLADAPSACRCASISRPPRPPGGSSKFRRWSIHMPPMRPQRCPLC